VTAHTISLNQRVCFGQRSRILITDHKMECAECARLKTRREELESRQAKAMAMLSTSTIGGIVGDFLETRKAADQAQLDLDSLDAEIAQHQNSHA
jgi:hypothetical protein